MPHIGGPEEADYLADMLDELMKHPDWVEYWNGEDAGGDCSIEEMYAEFAPALRYCLDGECMVAEQGC